MPSKANVLQFSFTPSGNVPIISTGVFTQEPIPGARRAHKTHCRTNTRLSLAARQVIELRECFGWMKSGDFAMLPGVFLSTPGSGEGFTSRRPDAAGELDFLEHFFNAKCVLFGLTNYFTAGQKRSASSFHEAMILAFVFSALCTLPRRVVREFSIRSCTRRCASVTEVAW